MNASVTHDLTNPYTHMSKDQPLANWLPIKDCLPSTKSEPDGRGTSLSEVLFSAIREQNS